ncbi:MAG: double-strand break repair helicase AddA [Alphaproteobacteria bacterium]|nr:double-strand break repair helicase AddA [Alphaproteobacteria bacterium]
MNARDAVARILSEATAAQQSASDPRASVWVDASAGSGKTTVLTARLLRLLLAGTPPSRVLCLTFTRAAAAEMAGRVRARLGRWATIGYGELAEDLGRLLGAVPDAEIMARARGLFRRVLDAPGGLRLLTLHAFCQSVLRRFPLEAGLAPHFSLVEDNDAQELLREAQAEIFAEAGEANAGPLAEALSLVTARVHETNFPELMEEVLRERGRISRLLARGGAGMLHLRTCRHLMIDPEATYDGLVAAACADGAFDRSALAAAAEVLAQGHKTDQARAVRMKAWLAADGDGRVAAFDDWLGICLTQKLAPRRRLARKDAAAAIQALSAETGRLLDIVDDCRKADIARATHALIVLAAALIERYAGNKAAIAAIDYDDLIAATARLMGANRAAWVLYKLDGGIDHVLIDEAQDTNPDQWAVVRALTGEFYAGSGAHDDAAAARTLFVVGDAKQSIFAFQSANPRAFAAEHVDYRAAALDGGADWRDIGLDISFRSTPAVLRAVDAVFAGDNAREGVVAEGASLRHQARREGHAGAVELWPVLRSEGPPPAETWKPPVERVGGESARTRLARLLARRIAQWLAEGERLDSKDRPMRPGDILVLVRRRDPMVEEIVRALKDERVPVSGVDRMRLVEQMAVMDLMALGRFLLLPQDDLTLACVLKSPLLGIDETGLFTLAHGRPGTLWQSLAAQAGADPAFAAAHALLAGLLARADMVRPYELYSEVLVDGGGRNRLLARLGRDAADPIDEFLSLALAYERAHVPSLEGFLHWVETANPEVKRDLDQASDAVRVMTVHGAKGLEAPVVILPDTTQIPRGNDRLLWPEDAEAVLWSPAKDSDDSVAAVARDRADIARAKEYRRLLYVALTRAADRLLVCGWVNRREPSAGCWYELVRAGLYGRSSAAQDPFLAANGIDDATILRMADRQDAPPERDRPRPDTSDRLLPDWLHRAPPPEPEPTRPLTPSRAVEGEPPLRSPAAGEDGRAFARGRFVHLALQLLAALPQDRRAAAATRLALRVDHGLGEATARAAAASVLKVLDDPATAPLWAPASLAEVPVAGLVAGPPDSPPRTIAGRIDRLAVLDDRILVADFKTGRAPPADPAATPRAWLAQMAAYRALIAGIWPDRPVECWLVWTDAPAVQRLPESLLDAHAPAARGAKRPSP